MCPNIEISRGQGVRVGAWACDVAKGDANLTVGEINNEERVLTYSINGEPLTMYVPIQDPGSVKKNVRLLCSDKHAESLEKAGIVKFPKSIQEKVVSSNSSICFSEWEGHP